MKAKPYGFSTTKSKKPIAAVCFSAAIALVVLFSLFIGVSSRKTTVLARSDLYAICFYEGKDATEATLAAQSLTLRGGAGYVQKEGLYRVLACVYFSREKANEVCKNIVALGGNCRVIPLTVNAVRLPKKRGADANLVLRVSALFKEAIEGLSSAFAAADRGEERALVLSSLSPLAERLSTQRSALNYAVGVSEGVKRAAEEFLSVAIERLRSLEKENSLFSLSVGAKYAMLKITDEFRGFCGNFA